MHVLVILLYKHVFFNRRKIYEGVKSLCLSHTLADPLFINEEYEGEHQPLSIYLIITSELVNAINIRTAFKSEQYADEQGPGSHIPLGPGAHTVPRCKAACIIAQGSTQRWGRSRPLRSPGLGIPAAAPPGASPCQHSEKPRAPESSSGVPEGGWRGSPRNGVGFGVRVRAKR